MLADLDLYLFDTQGFETGEAGDKILARLGEEIRSRQVCPISDQAHVVWSVVRAGDRRFENSQAHFVERLVAMRVPVIVVLGVAMAHILGVVGWLRSCCGPKAKPCFTWA